MTEGAARTEPGMDKPGKATDPSSDAESVDVPAEPQKALIDGILRDYAPVLRELGQR